MIFQTLDDKSECVGVYVDGKLHFDGIPDDLTKTWKYTGSVQDDAVEYAWLYCGGKDLQAACPEHLKGELTEVQKTFKAYLKSFQIAKINLRDNCFFDLVPSDFLMEFCEVRNKVTEHVFETYSRPENYDHMFNLVRMIEDIGSRTLNIDIEPIKHLLSSVKGQNFHRTLRSTRWVCDYNPWGTVTGRLSANPKSFPILTMGKEFRSCVKPTNDWLFELDFNAAELRVLLALSGEEQPKNDIHDWNVETVFNNKLTREDAKTKTFAWLYSSNKNNELEQLYNKDFVRNKFWDGYKIKTDYGRIMENVDEHHALNYIVQSTTIDMVHEQAYKIFKLLEGKKSNIAFLIHDAVYIDLAEEDKYEITKLLDTFKQTRYGLFKVNVSAGRDLGEMKKLKL